MTVHASGSLEQDISKSDRDSQENDNPLSSLESSLSTEPQTRLLGRIRSKVPVEISTVEIAGHQVPWLKVVDPDRLLENALERKDRSPKNSILSGRQLGGLPSD